MAVLRIGIYGTIVLPVGYGVPLVLAAWFRSRRILWGLAACFLAINAWKFFIAQSPTPSSLNPFHDRGAGLIVVLDLLSVAVLVDFWIRSQQSLEIQKQRAESRAAELSARREEIARQNEELQSQAEELERQSEELRVANEELGLRGGMLEGLLDLSRNLRADLSPGETMRRICAAASQMVAGSLAAAILTRRGDKLECACQHGFEGGLASSVGIPYENSFARLVIDRGRTGYIEDLARRPDVTMPQPAAGARLQSVLAAPLRVSGEWIGTLEIYSPQPRAWSAGHVAIIESLAAQASISLESCSLFETVTAERLRLQTVLRTVPFGIGISNADCSEVRLNTAGAALLHVPEGTNIAKTNGARWTILRDGKRLEFSELAIARACREGVEIPPHEEEIVVNGQGPVHVLASAAPIRDGSGRIIGAVNSLIDITAQKQLQRELDTRRRDAEQSAVRKSRFLAAVSHDIRTPANAISLLAELIQRTAQNPEMAGEIPELAQELHSSASSLVTLIGDVLDLTRLDTGGLTMHETEFSLGQMLHDECRQLLPLAQQKKLDLQCQTPPGEVRVRLDRVKVGRVVSNLIGNAIKFTDEGSVRVELRILPDARPQIRVEDTGIGIDAEHLPRIFDEFFQLKNPDRLRQHGSGLGLSISRRLMNALRGSLDVESTPGRGSTFTATFPASVVVRD